MIDPASIRQVERPAAPPAGVKAASRAHPRPLPQWNSIRFKLSAAFLLFLLHVVLLGVFSITQLSDVNRVSEDIRDHWLQSTRILGDLNNFTSDYRAAEASHVLSSGPAEIANAEREISELDLIIGQSQARYEQVLHDEFEREIYARFSSQWRDYRKIAGRVFELSHAGRKSDGSALYMTESGAAYAAASDTLGRLTALTVSAASEASGRAAATYTSARRLVLAAILLGALNSIAVLIYITRSISRPLLGLAQNMHLLSSNETDIDIHGTERRDEVGEMARAVVVFRNNAIELAHSQRGLVQQASMLAEKLEHEQRLTTMQRNFVSMASHEFRTPLTIIDGHAQRLIKAKHRPQPRDIEERAQKIRVAVLRMTRVMDNLLTSSRLFDGDASLYFHPSPIDLADLLRDVCQFHREISPATRIAEEIDRNPLPLTGDAHLLFQAFSNLVSNAVKYSPNEGYVRVAALADAAGVLVTVEDNGLGIPGHDLPELFARYHRGSNVTGITGTGVGLYLVKMVVSLHRGEVSVDSTEGRGSRFAVRLPAKAGGRAAVESPARGA